MFHLSLSLPIVGCHHFVPTTTLTVQRVRFDNAPRTQFRWWNRSSNTESTPHSPLTAYRNQFNHFIQDQRQAQWESVKCRPLDRGWAGLPGHFFFRHDNYRWGHKNYNHCTKPSCRALESLSWRCFCFAVCHFPPLVLIRFPPQHRTQQTAKRPHQK